jgi:hypothetical protein
VSADRHRGIDQHDVGEAEQRRLFKGGHELHHVDQGEFDHPDDPDRLERAGLSGSNGPLPYPVVTGKTGHES